MKHPILDLYNQMNNFGRLNNMVFEVINPGEIIYHFTPNSNHLATTTAVHGGVLSAYMDAIIGVAALSAVCEENKLVSTVEFKINYLLPAFCDKKLTGKGRVISKGNSILVSTGEIINEENKVIAVGQGTFKSYPSNYLK